MKTEILHRNLKKVATEIDKQIGAFPGNSAGLCQKIVLGALSGANIDYRYASLTPARHNSDIKEAGVQFYPLFFRTCGWDQAIQSVLTDQDQTIGLDALLVRGKIKDSRLPHIVAVVPNEGHAPYTIVDSRLQGAHASMVNISEVQEYLLEERFTEPLNLFLVPNAPEHARREGSGGKDFLEIGETVFIAPRINYQP